jgi:Zn-dependent metalloprotease
MGLAMMIALFASACASSGTSATAPQSPATNVAVASAAEKASVLDQSRYGAQALAYLEQNRGEYRISDPRAELRFKSETIDELNHKHVRFQQVYNGVPVWRREIIVHFNERDEVHTVSNGLMSGLGLIDVNPGVTAEAARNAATQAKGEGWQASDDALYVFMHDMRPWLAYEVTLTRGLERWFVFVNARDGQVIHQMTGSPSAQ